MRKLRKAARVVGRARDCVRRSLAKAMLPLEEMNYGVTVSFVCLVFRESVSCLHYSGPEVNWELGVESLIVRRIDIAKFGGDIKLCLCVACWNYLIYIQLGFLARNP